MTPIAILMQKPFLSSSEIAALRHALCDAKGVAAGLECTLSQLEDELVERTLHANRLNAERQRLEQVVQARDEEIAQLRDLLASTGYTVYVTREKARQAVSECEEGQEPVMRVPPAMLRALDATLGSVQPHCDLEGRIAEGQSMDLVTEVLALLRRKMAGKI